MKTLTVIISGAPEGANLKDVEIESGTTAGDLTRALSLQGYLLSPVNSDQVFANEEPIYSRVEDGDKLKAVPQAEVGTNWCRLRIRIIAAQGRGAS